MKTVLTMSARFIRFNGKLLNPKHIMVVAARRSLWAKMLQRNQWRTRVYMASDGQVVWSENSREIYESPQRAMRDFQHLERVPVAK